MAQPETTNTEQGVQEWRAREKAAFALFPILEREGLGTVSAGELADTVIDTYLRILAEPLPAGWKRHAAENQKREYTREEMREACRNNYNAGAGTAR